MPTKPPNSDDPFDGLDDLDEESGEPKTRPDAAQTSVPQTKPAAAAPAIELSPGTLEETDNPPIEAAFAQILDLLNNSLLRGIKGKIDIKRNRRFLCFDERFLVLHHDGVDYQKGIIVVSKNPDGGFAIELFDNNRKFIMGSTGLDSEYIAYRASRALNWTLPYAYQKNFDDIQNIVSPLYDIDIIPDEKGVIDIRKKGTQEKIARLATVHNIDDQVAIYFFDNLRKDPNNPVEQKQAKSYWTTCRTQDLLSNLEALEFEQDILSQLPEDFFIDLLSIVGSKKVYMISKGESQTDAQEICLLAIDKNSLNNITVLTFEKTNDTAVVVETNADGTVLDIIKMLTYMGDIKTLGVTANIADLPPLIHQAAAAKEQNYQNMLDAISNLSSQYDVETGESPFNGTPCFEIRKKGGKNIIASIRVRKENRHTVFRIIDQDLTEKICTAQNVLQIMQEIEAEEDAVNRARKKERLLVAITIATGLAIGFVMASDNGKDNLPPSPQPQKSAKEISDETKEHILQCFFNVGQKGLVLQRCHEEGGGDVGVIIKDQECTDGPDKNTLPDKCRITIKKDFEEESFQGTVKATMPKKLREGQRIKIPIRMTMRGK